MPQISIIIPVLNEAATIGALLKHIEKVSTRKQQVEIIVVDGGSIDETVTIAKNAGVTVIEAPKGRARQMNVGARVAVNDVLYFLHADSFPPKNYDALILNEISKGNQAGCFRMRFDSNHWWLRLASWLTQFSWRACRGGDQSQFITKALFIELGGFDEKYTIYEDNDLINKLYARKQFVVINKKLTTSCRLYKKKGVWKLQYHYWTIYVKKWLGASAEELHEYYKKKIAS